MKIPVAPKKEKEEEAPQPASPVYSPYSPDTPPMFEIPKPTQTEAELNSETWSLARYKPELEDLCRFRVTEHEVGEFMGKQAFYHAHTNAEACRSDFPFVFKV